VTRNEAHVADDLTALLDGALDPVRRAEVEGHLSACDACRAERDGIARALSAFAALPPPPPPPPGFEQRFYARLAREAPRRRSFLERLSAHPFRWLVPATGLAAALAVGIWVRQAGERADLEMARHLDLLENYVEVASLGVVETPEDLEVVAHLDELREGRP
jgi:anti-sigma factor RsiW